MWHFSVCFLYSDNDHILSIILSFFFFFFYHSYRSWVLFRQVRNMFHFTMDKMAPFHTMTMCLSNFKGLSTNQRCAERIVGSMVTQHGMAIVPDAGSRSDSRLSHSQMGNYYSHIQPVRVHLKVLWCIKRPMWVVCIYRLAMKKVY